MTAPFISSADLSDYLKLPAGVIDEGLATIAVDAACQVVRDYVDQPLDGATVTDKYLDGTGTATLILPAFPVASVSSVVLYADRTDTSPDTLAVNVDYVEDLERGVLHRIDGDVWTEGRQNVKVTFVASYASVPSSIRLVALQVAARVYEVGMTKSASVAGVSETYVEGGGSLTDDEREVLRGYRRSE